MSNADYLRLGDWNIRCDRCGKKMKGSEARLTWQGYYVCAADWEPRQPQDFVRGVVENPTPAFVRNPDDIDLGAGAAVVSEVEDWSNDPTEEPFYILHENGVRYILTES